MHWRKKIHEIVEIYYFVTVSKKFQFFYDEPELFEKFRTRAIYVAIKLTGLYFMHFTTYMFFN